MDFKEAISIHQKWKVRLRGLLDGASKEALDPTVMCKDDQCDLGKWMYGEGASMKGKPEFEEMKKKHAEFHRVAAEVVKKHQSKDLEGAKALLNGGFQAASGEVVTSIMKCDRACK